MSYKSSPLASKILPCKAPNCMCSRVYSKLDLESANLSLTTESTVWALVPPNARTFWTSSARITSSTGKCGILKVRILRLRLATGSPGKPRSLDCTNFNVPSKCSTSTWVVVNGLGVNKPKLRICVGFTGNALIASVIA